MYKQDILVSIRPKYVCKIMAGEKTVELRRRFPISLPKGARAFIYSSSPQQAVVGYALIKEVKRLPIGKLRSTHRSEACVSRIDFDEYFSGLEFGFAVILGKVKALLTPIDLNTLRDCLGIVPPQSYRYLQADCMRVSLDERIQVSDRYQRYHRP